MSVWGDQVRMTKINYNQLGEVQTATLDTRSTIIKPGARFDVMQGHLTGNATDYSADGIANNIFKGRCPLTGMELGNIGREFGINFAVNANPKDGFNVNVNDGPEAADELTQYQIMKGGYDGRNKLLTEFHRDHIEALDDPFITIDMYEHERSVEKLLGPLPEGAKPGTIVAYREEAWREEARRIIKSINAYNPRHHEICHMEKKFVAREMTEEEAHFHPRTDSQHLFHEDEIIEVRVTPITKLPRIRYLEGLINTLNALRGQLGYA
jgi:hypothetical protein